MSDIADDQNPIQSEPAQFRAPVSEFLIQGIGGALNFLLSLGFRFSSFAASGNFTVPASITQVILFGWGGGGGGSGGSGLGSNGGNGSFWGFRIVTVTPAAVIAVTIGAGGTAGSGTGNGGAGGNTTFGALATFKGAQGGLHNGTVTNILYPGETQGGIPPVPGSVAAAGQNSVSFTGGASGGGSGGSGGAAGPGGNGGAGGIFNGAGVAAAANSGAGGGSGGDVGGGFNTTGGIGGSGFLYVMWFGKS